MRPFPASTELLKKNIWGNFDCVCVPTSYSLGNSVARLRFVAALRTELLLGPARDLRVLGSAVPSEQFIANHAPAHALLDSEYFPALVSRSYSGADPGSHHSLSSSLCVLAGIGTLRLPSISLQNQTFFPVGSYTLRSDASAVRGERSAGSASISSIRRAWKNRPEK